MPMAFDPSRTIDIILMSDQDRPADQQTVFVCRFSTGSQRDKIEKSLRMQADSEGRLLPGESWESWRTRVVESIRPILAEIKNPPPVDQAAGLAAADQLPLILTDDELTELAASILARNSLEYYEIKKSKSRPLSAPG